jgi:hypothetical protein
METQNLLFVYRCLYIILHTKLTISYTWAMKLVSIIFQEELLLECDNNTVYSSS